MIQTGQVQISWHVQYYDRIISQVQQAFLQYLDHELINPCEMGPWFDTERPFPHDSAPVITNIRK